MTCVLDSSTDYYGIPNVVALVAAINIPPVHSTSPESGSHFPFPIHVDKLDPLHIEYPTRWAGKYESLSL